MFKVLMCLSSFLVLNFGYAQNMDLYKELIQELSSDHYFGRGIPNEGDIKSAKYIGSKFSEMNLSSFEDENYFQYFNISVNTFPGNMFVSIDGVELEPGVDYVATEYSKGCKGVFNLIYFDDTNSIEYINEIETEIQQASFLVIDYDFAYLSRNNLYTIYQSDFTGLILLQEPPIRWYVARSYMLIDKTILWINKDIFPKKAEHIEVDIQNVFIENYQTKNVIAYIEGSQYPDKYFAFTAHFDHLGMHGSEVFYPGANDNASGVAMLMILADYFSKPENRPEVSLMFMAFAAEESGLLGSKYYVENPIIPLEKIKYLINFDMVADNAESVYFEINDSGKKGFETLYNLNNQYNYFHSLDTFPLRAMSDHYFFAISQVPTAFIALHGDAFNTLHTLNDTLENIYLEKIPDLFHLIKRFINSYTYP